MNQLVEEKHGAYTDVSRSSDKILLYENNSEKGQLKLQVQQAAGQLQGLVNAYAALWDANTDEDLREFTMADTGRALRTQALGTNCSSCQGRGIGYYGAALAFITDRILDSASSKPTIGGLTLDRDKLRGIIQTPPLSRVEKFEQQMKAWEKSPYRHSTALDYLDIVDNKVTIDQAQLEADMQAMNRYVTRPDDIELYNDLKQFVELRNSINQRLNAKKQEPITLSERYDKPGQILYLDGSKYRLQPKKLAEFLR